MGNALTKKRQIAMIPRYISIFVLILLILIPLSLILIMSASDWSAFSKDFLSVFRTGIQWKNYVQAWEQGNMSEYFINTIVVMVLALFMINFFASLLAYSIKYYADKISNLAYYIVLCALFIPAQALMFPLYDVMSKLHLLNTYFGLALVYTGTSLPLATMLYTGFYRSIPKDLVEAASIDGCRSFSIYLRVFLPLSKTIAATVTILNGMTIWKDFFIPMIVVSDAHKKTISTSMQLFVSEYTTEWSSVCAAMVIQTIPIIILFLLLQKQFMEGMTAGAVKG